MLGLDGSSNLAASEPKGDRMPVYLNHFYVVVNQETYDAIKDSHFLSSQFAVFEERTTSSTIQQSWSGLYLYGANTYFEFLLAGSLGGMRTGDCGIGFGNDKEEDQEALGSRIAEHANVECTSYLMNRAIDGEHVPWFFVIEPTKTEKLPWFDVWTMQYHPEFLLKWHGDLHPRNGGVTRKAVLERYKAKILGEDVAPCRQFADITKLTLALPKKELTMLSAWLQALGYRRQEGGPDIVFAGPDVVFHLRPESKGQRGIVAAHLSVNADAVTEPVFFSGVQLEPSNAREVRLTFNLGAHDRIPAKSR